jgi:hypothetical protein
MIRFFLLLAAFILVCMFWLGSNPGGFKRENYVSQKVLEYAKPFDVKIDTQVLNSLKPANE